MYRIADFCATLRCSALLGLPGSRSTETFELLITPSSKNLACLLLPRSNNPFCMFNFRYATAI